MQIVCSAISDGLGLSHFLTLAHLSFRYVVCHYHIFHVKTICYLPNVKLAGVGGDCKLWISDRMVVLNKQSNIGSFRAIENILYEIKIEYSTVRFWIFSEELFRVLVLTIMYYLLVFAQDTHGIFLQLFWSSREMQKQIVPKNHLFSSARPIKDSPFHLTVLP